MHVMSASQDQVAQSDALTLETDALDVLYAKAGAQDSSRAEVHEVAGLDPELSIKIQHDLTLDYQVSPYPNFPQVSLIDKGSEQGQFGGSLERVEIDLAGKNALGPQKAASFAEQGWSYSSGIQEDQTAAKEILKGEENGAFANETLYDPPPWLPPLKPGQEITWDPKNGWRQWQWEPEEPLPGEDPEESGWWVPENKNWPPPGDPRAPRQRKEEKQPEVEDLATPEAVPPEQPGPDPDPKGEQPTPEPSPPLNPELPIIPGFNPILVPSIGI